MLINNKKVSYLISNFIDCWTVRPLYSRVEAFRQAVSYFMFFCMLQFESGRIWMNAHHAFHYTNILVLVVIVASLPCLSSFVNIRDELQTQIYQ